ncbi:helix-turn-helix transcriptional regulator [Catenulispora pinisilvae]|uniref:helix-turn-helix transcriptional regulator n=1 Tax=Catenulispora pinisilvae TaxID=2705253 RepID=UPI0018912F62|nr:helix-turn-helix transcriptional regulator [Catenulispora pinisilvae]
MNLDSMILGLLALTRFSGYDLRQWMDGRLKYIGYQVQLPQIYRRLAKLVERGWVEFEVDPRDGRPDAKLYSLTEAGREALWEWARSPYEPSARPADPDFLLRYLFGGMLDPEIAISVVRTELEYRQKYRSETGILDELPALMNPQLPEIDPRWVGQLFLSAHEYGFASNASYIAWLQLTLARLEGSSAT